MQDEYVAKLNVLEREKLEVDKTLMQTVENKRGIENGFYTLLA